MAAPSHVCACSPRRRICGCMPFGPCGSVECRRRGCDCHGLCTALGREPTDGDILDALLGPLIDRLLPSRKVA